MQGAKPRVPAEGNDQFERRRVRIRLLNLLVVILVVQEQFEVVARDLVALLDPRAQINHLAALGTKGPVRIILPRGLDTTSWTLDRQRHGFLGVYAD